MESTGKMKKDDFFREYDARSITIKEYVERLKLEKKINVIAKCIKIEYDSQTKMRRYLMNVVGILKNEIYTPFTIFLDSNDFQVSLAEHDSDEFKYNTDDYVKGVAEAKIKISDLELLKECLFELKKGSDFLLKEIERGVYDVNYYRVNAENKKMAFVPAALSADEEILANEKAKLSYDNQILKANNQSLSYVNEKYEEHFCRMKECIDSITKQFDGDLVEHQNSVECIKLKVENLQEIIQERKVELDKQRSEFEGERNKQIAELDKQRSEFEGERNKQIAELDKQKRDIENERKEITEKYKSLEKEKNKVEQVKLTQALFEKYDIYLDDTGDTETIDKFKIEGKSLNDIIKRIEALIYMDDECHWIYPRHYIKNFITGLFTNQLIILAGKPGSGKTSFVSKLTKVIGGKEAVIVPVQSNWMDKSDLLGYFNPVNQQYVPSIFLEKLVELITLAEKEKNADKLFFVCLDEMNLSFIEYYFADFLSKLQTNDRDIELYSKEVYNSAIADIEAKIEAIGDKKRPALVRILNNQLNCLRNKYKNTIHVPNNIKFIGTINNDETTKDLSPKVIDRAYFVRLETVNKLIFGDKAAEIYDLPVTKAVSRYTEIKSEKDANGQSNSNGILRGVLDECNKLLKLKEPKEQYLFYADFDYEKPNTSQNKILVKIRKEVEQFLRDSNLQDAITINHRFDKSVKNMLMFLLANHDNITAEKYDDLLDMIFSGLILPKIKLDIEGNENIAFQDKYNLPVAKEILGKMKKRDYVSYWI